MNEHLNDDKLIDVMYGLETGAHLESCAECSRRLNEMRQLRAQAAEPMPVSTDFLAAQRRTIYTRLGENDRRSTSAWIPALGAAALLAIGIAMYHPLRQSMYPAAPQELDKADAQLFSEVYSMEQADEPTVAAPLHSLFDDSQK